LVYGQWFEVVDGGFSLRTNYIANSFLQLPVLDYPVREWLGDNSYHKGIFDIGHWNESAARIGSKDPVTLASLVINTNGVKQLIVSNGITFINAQGVVSKSFANNKWFPRNIDYTNPAEDYIVGWLDPIGSHADYEPHTDINDVAQIDDLIYLLVHDQRTIVKN
jgi:hypothetical protein